MSFLRFLVGLPLALATTTSTTNSTVGVNVRSSTIQVRRHSSHVRMVEEGVHEAAVNATSMLELEDTHAIQVNMESGLRNMESASGTINVTVRMEGAEEMEFPVNPQDLVHKAVAQALEIQRVTVRMGGHEVSEGETFVGAGIEEGAKLDVAPRQQASFNEFVKQVAELNPHVNSDKLKLRCKGSPGRTDPLKFVGDVNWSAMPIEKLPESLGDVQITGDFNLGYCWLNSLPESIGNLRVGGDLDLSANELRSLPNSFANISVRGSIVLADNKLEKLPKNFVDHVSKNGLYHELCTDKVKGLETNPLGGGLRKKQLLFVLRGNNPVDFIFYEGFDMFWASTKWLDDYIPGDP